MKLYEAEQKIKEELRELYEEGEAGAIAAMTTEAISGWDQTERIKNAHIELSTEQSQTLERFLSRLKEHEPVQYITNRCWFYGMELYVDSRVLIPRPETEELVDWLVKDVKASRKNVFEKGAMQADDTTQLKILDIGTGSGCIALALKKQMPKAEVWGCDISEESLNVARRNGSDLDIRVDFQGINFLDESQQKFLPTVDIIVSNPPYVPQKDRAAMNPNVVNFEPHTALFVPDNDALVFYSAIAEFSKKRLYSGGSIYLEIHEELGKEVVDLFQQNGYSVELKKDMQGKDRMIKAVI